MNHSPWFLSCVTALQRTCGATPANVSSASLGLSDKWLNKQIRGYCVDVLTEVLSVTTLLFMFFLFTHVSKKSIFQKRSTALLKKLYSDEKIYYKTVL